MHIYLEKSKILLKKEQTTQTEVESFWKTIGAASFMRSEERKM